MSAHSQRMSILVSAIVASVTIATAVAAQKGAACAPSDGVRFVCGQSGPEDLVQIPGTRWLVASAFGDTGGLFLVDTRTASARRVFPDSRVGNRFDRKTYDGCPGPLNAVDRQRFRSHGLAIRRGTGSVHTLYVVHHGTGERESIEVFELDARAASPALTWIGCALAPGQIGVNSVVALPEGGFAATNFDPRSSLGGNLSAPLLAGRNNGEVWEWHTGTGWKKVPGSEASGANGIELSPDGTWFYISQWGNKSFMRLSRNRTPVSRVQIPLGFRVDNVRWAPDGTLLVAGQGGSDDAIFGRAQGPDVAPPRSIIGKVDPKSMTYREIINVPETPVIAAATVAVQIGNEFWTGAFRGDRLVIYPARPLKR